MAMDGIDGSAVIVALPTIAQSLGTDAGTASWVTVSYFMMMAALLLVFGKMAYRGAVKRVFVLGLGVFTFASLLCGISSSLDMLIAARVLQGVGASMLAAAAPIMCVKFLPTNRLGLGFGIITLGWSVGYALGPALGGFLTQYLSWHWIFLVNIPLGIAGILLSTRAVPEDAGWRKGESLDMAGAFLLFTCIVTGVFALERSSYMGSDNPVILLCSVFCAVSAAAFILTERKSARPILDLGMFGSWKFDIVLLSFFLFNMAYTGYAYLMPFFMDVELGFDSAVSGLYLLIPPVITLVLCVPIGRWSDRTQRRSFCIVSFAALTASLLVMFLVSEETGTVATVASLVMIGMSWAISGGAAASRVVETTKADFRGTASAMSSFAVYLACAMGTALFAAMFTAAAGSSGIPPGDLDPESFMNGFRAAMLAGTVMSAVAVVMSAAVRDR